jgi:hypothetical protein
MSEAEANLAWEDKLNLETMKGRVQWMMDNLSPRVLYPNSKSPSDKVLLGWLFEDTYIRIRDDKFPPTY